MSRSFGDTRALDHLTLEVPTGAVFGFLGPNGAGKTTTLRILLGLIRADAGTVEVLGYDPAQQGTEIRRRVGVLLERPGIYERLSAEQNLEFHGRLHGMDPAVLSDRSRKLLERAGLWDRRAQRAGTFSLGMRKKLALARALLHQPALLLLDEPTSGLDARAAALFRRDLAELAATAGTTIFLNTHNLPEAEQLCSHVAICNRGKVVDAGPPDTLRSRLTRPRFEINGRGFDEEIFEQIRAQPGVDRVTLRPTGLQVELAPDADVAPLVSLSTGHGVRINEVRRLDSSLEEVFLELTDAS